MRYIAASLVIVLLGLAGAIGYFVSRERPGPLVGGDYKAASAQAANIGARLLLVVDAPPPFL